MKNEKQILSMYTSPMDNSFPVFEAPFVQGDYVFACDRFILIRIAKSEIDGEYPNAQKPNCSSLFVETRKELTISIKTLKRLLAEVELVDEIKSVGEDIECYECEGDGTVIWEYKNHEKEDECPVCEGSGYSVRKKKIPTGKMIPNPNSAIKLGYRTFRVQYIEILIHTMKLLEMDKITMHYNEYPKHEVSHFVFNENISVLLMPYI